MAPVPLRQINPASQHPSICLVRDSGTMTLSLSGTWNAILNAILWLLPTFPLGDLDALSLVLHPLKDSGVQNPASVLPTKAICHNPPSQQGLRLQAFTVLYLHNNSGRQAPTKYQPVSSYS